MKPTSVTNKGSQQALLPSRRAMKILAGNSVLSSVGNYAKMSPSGNNGMFAPDIFEQGKKAPKVVPALNE